jgi:hypothetical protein
LEKVGIVSRLQPAVAPSELGLRAEQFRPLGVQRSHLESGHGLDTSASAKRDTAGLNVEQVVARIVGLARERSGAY